MVVLVMNIIITSGGYKISQTGALSETFGVKEKLSIPLQTTKGCAPTYYYCPQMKLGQGNIFTGVCLSKGRLASLHAS